MLTARWAPGATASGAGSLVTSAPAGISTDRRPSKYTAVLVPPAVPAPRVASATAARPTRSGALPKALVSRTRTRLPPALVSTISRSVAWRKPSPDRFPATAAWGLAPHVATQWLPDGIGTMRTDADDEPSRTASPSLSSASTATGSQTYRRNFSERDFLNLSPVRHTTRRPNLVPDADGNAAGGQPSILRTSPSTFGSTSSLQ